MPLCWQKPRSQGARNALCDSVAVEAFLEEGHRSPSEPWPGDISASGVVLGEKEAAGAGAVADLGDTVLLAAWAAAAAAAICDGSCRRPSSNAFGSFTRATRSSTVPCTG